MKSKSVSSVQSVPGVLQPGWDEDHLLSHMRASMSDRAHRNADACLYCCRPLTGGERATCQHCDLQWRSWRRAQARAAKFDRTLCVSLYIIAAICIGIILGELVNRL